MKKINLILDEIKTKKALVVFPHPDDESVMAGGLIQKLIQRGYLVTVLCLTEGEKGQIHVKSNGKSAREIRSAEMATAMSVLGVLDWVLWSFEDGGLRENNKWRKQLRQFVHENKFELIVTYDLSGVSGHPDHISLSKEVLNLSKSLSRTKLLWVSFAGRMKEVVVNKKVEDYLQPPEFELKLNFLESFRKWRAAFSHRSQKLQNFLGLPWWVLVFVARREWYVLVDKSKKYKYKFVGFRI